MSDYEVNVSAMNAAASGLSELSRQLGEMSWETNRLASGLEARNLSEQYIKNSILYAAEQLQGKSQEYARCAVALQNCIQRYEMAEGRVLQGTVPVGGSLPVSTTGSVSSFFTGALLGTAVYGAEIGETDSGNLEGGNSSGSFWQDHVTTSVSGLEWDSVEHQVEGNASATVQVTGDGASWQHGNASYGVGAATAAASLQAGLDQTGSVPIPHVEASAGLSACILQADVSGALGNEMLGVEGHGSASGGKVEASGNLDLFLFQGDGGLNPTASVGGTLEALVGEATAGMTANLFGIGVTAEGSVSFGAGVHANAGFENGVVSCDFGVALGPGGSVSVSVDLGTIWGAILSEAESVMNFETELFSTKA